MPGRGSLSLSLSPMGGPLGKHEAEPPIATADTISRSRVLERGLLPRGLVCCPPPSPPAPAKGGTGAFGLRGTARAR
jgi:hypothetical protein